VLIWAAVADPCADGDPPVPSAKHSNRATGRILPSAYSDRERFLRHWQLKSLKSPRTRWPSLLGATFLNHKAYSEQEDCPGENKRGSHHSNASKWFLFYIEKEAQEIDHWPCFD
jgi:hypothetical protein